MNGSENAPMTPEERWDNIGEDNAYLEGQKEKFADNPEIQAKIMKYLSQNEAMMQKILDDIDKEEAGTGAEVEQQIPPKEMNFSELGSAAVKASDSKEYYVDKDGFVHGNREDAIGNSDDNRNASFGRAS